MLHLGNSDSGTDGLENSGQSLPNHHEHSGSHQSKVQALPYSQQDVYQDGYIFRFHPSQIQQACKVVGGLLVFLTGIWCETINTLKSHKFFTDGMIEHLKNAWWDATTLCMVTKANQEIANILTFDMDLIFLETKVELDMSRATTPAEMIAKIQDDLLSTSSISTFHTATTMATQTTKKRDKHSKPKKASEASSTNTDSVFSSVTFSENDLGILLAHLVQAMTLQQKSPPKNSSKEPIRGQNTGRQK